MRDYEVYRSRSGDWVVGLPVARFADRATAVKLANTANDMAADPRFWDSPVAEAALAEMMADAEAAAGDNEPQPMRLGERTGA